METPRTGKDPRLEVGLLNAEEVRAVFEKYKSSPAYPAFEEILDHLLAPFSGDPTPIYKKDKNLSVLIHKLLENHEFPIVDKTSRLVFAPRSHEMIMAVLYCLYKNIPLADFGELRAKSDEYAQKYTDEGMGYNWTAMPTFGMGRNTTPIVGKKYQPTREDKDAWLMIGYERKGDS